MYEKLPSLIGVLVNLYLFFFVLLKKIDKDFKINFLIYLFGIIGFCISEYSMLNSHSQQQAIFFLRVSVIFLYLLIPAFMIILIYLININLKTKKVYYLYLLYLPIPFFILRMDLIITELRIYSNYYEKWGMITEIIVFLSLIYIPICMFFLIKGFLKNKNDIYLKKPFLFLTIFLTTSMSVFWINLLLQGVFKNFSYQTGIFSITLTISAIIIFYLIYRFNFLNIQIFLKNILIYILTAIFTIISIILYIILTHNFKIIVFTAGGITFIFYIFFKQKTLNIIQSGFIKAEAIFIKSFSNYIEKFLFQKKEKNVIKTLDEILKNLFNATDTFIIKDRKLKTDFLEITPFTYNKNKKIINHSDYQWLKK